VACCGDRIDPSKLNVIVTHNSRSAVSSLFGYIQEAYFFLYEKELEIHFEEITPTTATKSTQPLPQGWYDVHNVDPQKLLERGYDKVIHVSRELIDLSKALAQYHRQVYTLEDAIKLSIREPLFFKNISRKHEKVHSEVDDPHFLRFSLFEYNNFTKQTINKVLDFLEFPKERKILLLIVKPDRDFEAYSNDHNHEMSEATKEKLEKIRGKA
jgi:hypothetical protein